MKRNKLLCFFIILIVSLLIINQPCTILSNTNHVKIPTEKLEIVADIPSLTSVCWGLRTWRFIQLKNGNDGLALIREVNGLLTGPCYLLELYDLKEKRKTKDIFLGTRQDFKLDENLFAVAEPDILVDKENNIYIGYIDIIIICDNELKILDFILPDLKGFNLYYYGMLFIKDNKIFFGLLDGKIASIDKNTGKAIDNIYIDKEKYPELKNLGTYSINNYSDSFIAIFYKDFPNSKIKENRKVVFIYNIEKKLVEQKFIYDKDHFLTSMCTGFRSSFPYLFFIFSDSDDCLNFYVQNTETKWENILQLEVGLMNTQLIINKIGDEYFCYFNVFYFGDDPKDIIYKLNLTEYLEK